MADFIRKKVYRLVVSFRVSEDSEEEDFEEHYFGSFEEAEKAAELLESGADPWYGDEVTSVEVDPESVEREILYTDRSRLHRMQGPERSGRAR
ncbi:MAG: hypothetical protein MR940_10435 [Lachnospiraceae bacterium]|nr:hypothetical protein [Lachnospiraceae bacterium]